MLGGIGDILAATPTIEALHRIYPDARITALTRQRLAPLLAGHPAVARVIGYDSRIRGRVLFFRELRRTRIDLWVDLHAPTFHTVSSPRRVFLRNAIIMSIACTRDRLGFAVPVMKPLLTHAVSVPDEHAQARTNIVDTTLELVPGGARYPRTKRLDITVSDLAWARRQLAHSDAPRYAFFFGGRQGASHWPVPRAAAFARLLLEKFDHARLLLIGDIHERAMVEQMLRQVPVHMHERVDNMVSKSGLTQTAALLALCAGAVCSDSGPMHMAEAVGIPLVALFSSKNHVQVWAPVGPRTIVINYPVDCGPCFNADCPIGNRCMDMIQPDEVLAALIRVTASAPASG